MFYYYKNHYISQGKLYCVYQSDHRLTEEEIEEIHKGQPELLDDTTVYEGTEPFTGYPIKDRDTIRPATDKELLDLGIITLKEGEILEGDTIKKIPKPSYQYKWTGSAWVIDEKKLKEGEIIENGEIKYIAPPEMVEPYWNAQEKKWEEKATAEEIKSYYFKKINDYKAWILENGYDYNGHQQKCREKDLALLGNAISALDDMQTFGVLQEEPNINWAFNDNDIVSMSETDLRKLRMAGATFVNVVYGVEAELKLQEPNIHLNMCEIMNKIDELSNVKCYKILE